MSSVDRILYRFQLQLPQAGRPRRLNMRRCEEEKADREEEETRKRETIKDQRLRHSTFPSNRLFS